MAIQQAVATETLSALGGQGLAGMLNTVIDGIESGADPGHTHTLAEGATDVTATYAELNYVDGVTSSVQTQLDAKQVTITGAATTIDTENLTASRALVSNASGKVIVATTTATEIGYVNGVTSAIQTQLGTKSPTASPTFTGTVTAPVVQGSASAASFPQVKGVKDLGAVGATETVNWANGDRQLLTLDENLTITFSNPAAGQTLTLYLLQDGTGTNTIAWADTITWQDGITWGTTYYTTTANKMNIVIITYVNSAYFGVVSKFA